MLPVERINAIQDMLKTQRIVRVEDLVRVFNVSDMTIRRDFEKLEQHGLAKRCYGGITLRSDITFDSEYKEREVLNQDTKQEIAAFCYRNLVADNEIIYLDAGSTVLALAKMLCENPSNNLTIITNDLIIANYLLSKKVNLIMIGGRVQQGLGCVHGYTAESQLDDLRMDVAFVSGLTVDADFDLFATTEQKVYFRKKLLEKCNRSYLLMDSSKFYKQSVFRIHNVNQYTATISDKVLTDSERHLASKLGINWISTREESAALHAPNSDTHEPLECDKLII